MRDFLYEVIRDNTRHHLKKEGYVAVDIGSGFDVKASCEEHDDDHADAIAAVVLCVMNTKTDSSVGITFSRV